MKLSVTSRRSSATSLSTSSRRWALLHHHPLWRRATSFPTVRSSPSATSDSVLQRPSSSLHSLEWNLLVSTRPATTASWSATSTSVRTCTPTPLCLEVPRCSQESPTGCRRRSRTSLHHQWRSRSSLHPRGNTPYGSVAPSWPPSPPSSRCGSASRSTMSPAHPSYTGSASKSKDTTPKLSKTLNPKETTRFIFVQPGGGA